MSNAALTLAEVVSKTAKILQQTSSTAHLDAELLVMHCVGVDRARLLAYPEQPLSTEQIECLEHLTARASAGEPIAYCTGYKAFWTLDLKVTPDTLIPRPETEHLVEWMLANLPQQLPLKIADLGVGSGAIALALAQERSDWCIDATDQSANALAVAKENAARYQLSNVHFYLGHWMNPLPHRAYDAIVSNPPYIAAQDTHLAQLQFEPQSALSSGEDGLDAIRHIATHSLDYLVPGGAIIIEHGCQQANAIITLMQAAGYIEVEDHVDLAQQPRYVTARKEV